MPSFPPSLPAPPVWCAMPPPQGLVLPSPEELGLAAVPCKALIPDDKACFALWEKYAMFSHIQEHSKGVALVAELLARRAVELQQLDKDAIAIARASALLHDIAKSYTLQYGGSHAQLGASWSLQHTGHYGIAQGIVNHVEWPWPYPAQIAHTALFVLYADKRVQHTAVVTLTERYEDLLVRYGRTKESVASIRYGWERALELERALEAQLEIDIREYSFNSGGLVP